MKLAPAPVAAPPFDALYLARVETQLHDCLASERRRLLSLAPDATHLVDELERVIGAGGKRLRPLLCLWGYLAAGGDEIERLAAAGAALEMLHTSALIHDDVLDRSRLRRGSPTSFRRLGELAGDQRERFGGAAAILAGDLAQSLTDRLLAGSGFPSERVVAALVHVDRARVDAVTGEFLDLLAAARDAPSDLQEAHIRRVAGLKSGSYSVVGPLLVGATLAGGAPNVIEALGAYGRPLGEAFQLRDDLLGTFGDPPATGKDPDDDLREGKRNLLFALALEAATPDDRRTLEGSLGRPDLSPGQADAARRAIERSGAVATVTARIDALTAGAVAALRTASVPEDVRAALERLAGQMVLRTG